MVITLSASEQAQLFKTKTGDRNRGGFQRFMVQLQQRVGEDGRLELRPQDLEVIERYANYDNGGFEGRLRAAFGRHLPKMFPSYSQNLFI